ncbi:MAG: hypothetical protein QOE08_1473 [Thermoleophilaceae bacterium]|nr:hypothetical protein [Thermoleophilaceae bacterium]
MSVIGLMLAGIALFLYIHFESGLDDGINSALTTRADDLSAVLQDGGVGGLQRRRDILTARDGPEQVLDSRGAVLFSSSGSRANPLITPAEARSAGGRSEFIDRHERDRLLVRRGPSGSVLVVQASLEQRERALALLNGALIVGGALTLLIASLAGYGLAGAVLRPMEEMRRAAAQISDVDPHARLPLPEAQDEVHRLGQTLNDMLARVERARDRERAFVSDASHELRTPLAILKAEVEVALRTDNPPEALRAALSVAGEEADRLTQLAEQLLVIAQSESGRMELDRRPITPRALLEAVEQRFRTRAAERGRAITVEADERPELVVDVPRIEQALSNLVDNALRHAAGPITLSASPNGATLELHVLDEGSGLPADFVPLAFERFSRAERGRTGHGSGLGLSIVELIGQAHGGGAGVANRTNGAGADAWLWLPLRDVSHPASIQPGPR